MGSQKRLRKSNIQLGLEGYCADFRAKSIFLPPPAYCVTQGKLFPLWPVSSLPITQGEPCLHERWGWGSSVGQSYKE